MHVKYLSLLAIAVMMTACGGGDDPTPPPPSPAPSPAPRPVPGSIPTVINGSAKLLAGSIGGNCGLVDGVGDAARLGTEGAMVFHQGKLWLADAGCGDATPPGVRVIDPDSGVTSTYAVKPANSGAGKSGFTFPTGIGFDSKQTLYVSDGPTSEARYGGYPLSPGVPRGFAAGVWKISSSNMEILAGVDLNTGSVDGKGLSAGFDKISGMVVSGDQIIVNDRGALRSVDYDGTVKTLNKGFNDAPPFLIGSDAFGIISSTRAVQNAVTGTVSEVLKRTWNIVIADKNDLYLANYSPNTYGTIYRKKENSSDYVPVVTHAFNLHAAAIGDDDRLYLKLGNSIVQVKFQTP